VRSRVRGGARVTPGLTGGVARLDVVLILIHFYTETYILEARSFKVGCTLFFITRRKHNVHSDV
jgi:hypothetical protein